MSQRIPEDIKFGLLGLRMYRSWVDMKNRCHSPKHPRYHQYGGRGILVCQRWKKSFLNYYLDMGNPPSAKHQIDRVDNNKGYNKNNCKWSTVTDNVRNSRVTKLTPEIVSRIKSRLFLSDRVLAEICGVTTGAINAIRRGVTWKEIKPAA